MRRSLCIPQKNSCKVLFSIRSGAPKILPAATCCSLGMSHRLRELNRTNLPREAIAAGAFGNRPDKGRVRCSPFTWTRTPKCSKPFVGGPVLLHNWNEKGVLVLDLDDHKGCHCVCTTRLVRTCYPHCSLLSTRSCWLHSCTQSATFLTASSFAFLASLSGLVLGVHNSGYAPCAPPDRLLLDHPRSSALFSVLGALLLPATSHPSQPRV